MFLAIKNLSLFNFFKNYGLALLYVIYFFPVSFVFSDTQGAIKNLLSGDKVGMNYHFKFIFYFVLLCYTGFKIFKADIYQKKIFFKVFCWYIGVLSFLFVNTWVFQGAIQFQAEEYAFCLYFLPSTFLALCIEEKDFLRCLQILCCVLGIFFIKWFFYGKFFEKDYLGFYTCISLCGIYLITCNLTLFKIHFILFVFYLHIVYCLYFFSSGIGQVAAFLFIVYCFCIFKKNLKLLFYVTICLSALCFFTPNISCLKNTILYKINVRKKLIRTKEVQNLFVINRYRLKSSNMLSEGEYFIYPHNSFVESYIVYGILGFLWYCLVNIFAFIGLMKTKRKYLFVLIFIFLSLISLKQGAILHQKLLILFHVFGVKMFFQYKYLKNKEREIKKFN